MRGEISIQRADERQSDTDYRRAAHVPVYLSIHTDLTTEPRQRSRKCHRHCISELTHRVNHGDQPGEMEMTPADLNKSFWQEDEHYHTATQKHDT